MARRLIWVLSLVLLLAIAAPIARADEPPGAKLYDTYCSSCHGAGGQNGFAPAIGSTQYLGAHDDGAITQVVQDGLVAKGMPAWSKAKGGTLSDEQIADIVAYLRGLASPSATAPANTTTQAAQTNAAPAVFVQTNLKLDQVTTPEGATLVKALLAEYNGYPVAGAQITFARPTMFGNVALGSAKTGANGVASVTLPNLPEGVEVVASFKGMEKWEASQTQLTLATGALQALSGNVDASNVRLSLDEPLLAPEGSLITPNPPLVPATLFVLVVLGVWGLYLFVVSQMVGIWKLGHIPPRENTLRRLRR